MLEDRLIETARYLELRAAGVAVDPIEIRRWARQLALPVRVTRRGGTVYNAPSTAWGVWENASPFWLDPRGRARNTALRAARIEAVARAWRSACWAASTCAAVKSRCSGSNRRRRAPSLPTWPCITVSPSAASGSPPCSGPRRTNRRRGAI